MLIKILSYKKYFLPALALIILAGVWLMLPQQASKSDILQELKQAADAQDYEKFAANLKIAYDKDWVHEITETNEAGQGRNEFVNVESALYIKETERFHTGEVEHTLEVGTIIHKAVPASWRFRYLRTRSMEKLGRDALQVGDLAKAEDYAKQILTIMYDAQGANLLADVYFKKLEADIAAKNKEQAVNDLNFIAQYQLTAEKQTVLNQLKLQVDK